MRHVTLPLMSPVIFYSLTLGLVEVMQYFLVPFVLKNGTGEPGGTTYFFNLYIYKSFFTFQRMSYGATLAWLLFLDDARPHRCAVRNGTPLGLLRGRALTMAATSQPDRSRTRRPRTDANARFAPRLRNGGRSFLLTLIVTCLVAAFLAPLLQSARSRSSTRDQITQLGAPLWPADPLTFDYNGRTLDVYDVPIDGQTISRSSPRAHLERVRRPADPDAGPISWQGSWRSLGRARGVRAASRELRRGLGPARIPAAAVQHGRHRRSRDDRRAPFVHACRLWLRAVPISRAATSSSCCSFDDLPADHRDDHPDLRGVAPAGRHRRPNPIIAWAPLLVPTFFANAYDVFLMRQYFMTIPREMDEAAAMDGAGPFRTLVSMIIPQSWPVIIAVGIFHFVYSWNNFFEPLIYLTTQPELQPLAVGLQRFNGIHSARTVAAPGRHAHDARHPGRGLHHFPAGVHPRRRHHRGRQIATDVVLAVDGGNSKTDVALVARSGEVLARVRGATVSHQAMERAPVVSGWPASSRRHGRRPAWRTRSSRF